MIFLRRCLTWGNNAFHWAVHNQAFPATELRNMSMIVMCLQNIQGVRDSGWHLLISGSISMCIWMWARLLHSSFKLETSELLSSFRAGKVKGTGVMTGLIIKTEWPCQGPHRLCRPRTSRMLESRLDRLRLNRNTWFESAAFTTAHLISQAQQVWHTCWSGCQT